ncbi:MAG: exodeoxyribonuclease III [Acidimicrobiia bacterium]
MRIATWNVNSLAQRLPRVEAWLAEVRPDVLCLQETKLADTAVPAMALSALGYEIAHHGEGRWNGVAICSRRGLDDVVTGFAAGLAPDDQARLVTATCGGVRVLSAYVPNGRELGHDHYRYKLDWLQRLEAHLGVVAGATTPVALCGDLNIAPADLDVWDPRAFEGATHVSEAERAAFARLLGTGLHDVVRDAHPEVPGLYSWWDYRAGDFHKGRGMRIDHVLLSSSLAERVRWVLIDRNARKGDKPSDHAPVVVEVASDG